jgi:glycosyltransferase involved in cell wall biosynthesis
VLVAHNRYRSATPSGENTFVASQRAALTAAGVEVVPLDCSSDDLPGLPVAQRLAVAAGPVHNPFGVRRMRDALARHRPDVVHVHNTVPLLSPSVLREARRAGVPVVHTVHNFRQDCVNGLYFRDGAVCTDCHGRAVALPAVAHGCYRGSRLQSVPMVVGRSVHRSTWARVDAFVALSRFHRDYLGSLGIDPARVTVVPTACEDPGPTPPPGRDLLFLGRLTPEKGAGELLDAWERACAGSGPPDGRRLVLAGDGPLLGPLRRRAERLPGVEVTGPQDAAGVGALLRRCGVVVVPSRWYEGYPRAAVEALAHGRALLVSDLGALPAVVAGDDAADDADGRAGWTAAPDAAALAVAIRALTDEDVGRCGRAARRRYESAHTPEVTTAALLGVYRRLVAHLPGLEVGVG